MNDGNDTSAKNTDAARRKWRMAELFTPEWVMVMLTVITMAITLWYSARQLRVVVDQLKQSESATRPWVGLDVDAGLKTTDISFGPDGTATLVCTVTAKNFGTYPAQNVMGYAELMLSQDLRPVYAREKALCEQPGPDRGGAILFPGDAKSEWQWPSQVKPSEMIRTPGGGDTLLAFIVGCITYRDQFGKRHHTGFCYQLKVPGSIRGATFAPTPGTSASGVWVVSDSFVD